VYADAEEVVLLIDDREVARGPVGEQRPLLAELETTYSPGELVAVAYRDGTEVGRTTLATAGAPRLAVSSDRDRLRNDDADLAYVAVELRDADGRLVTGADRPVTVSVAGAGRLAGMCSANPKTTERLDADTWTTFDGRALAVVRPTGAGPVTVTVTSPGLEAVTVPLEVEQ
jgi:beta-galactosidase